MTLNEYQHGALETAVYPEEKRIIYPTLGLAGESGEVAEKVKKVFRDNNCEFTQDRKDAIALEIGDVLWYCATLANDIGFSLEQVCQMNLEKLRSRKERDKISGDGDFR